MTILEGHLSATDKRFCIIATRWNEFIVKHLLEGAISAIVRHGGSKESITVVYCPGSYEVPLVTLKSAQTGKYDAIITLGAVIRGATPHFEMVAGEVTKGVASAMMQTGVPCLFGVLTTDTIEQAIERAGTKAGNKGAEVAIAAIEMANLMPQL